MHKMYGCWILRSQFTVREGAAAVSTAAGQAHDEGLLMRRLVLEGALFAQFFAKVEVTNFEVASDAFATFKDLLTRHKALVARFLAAHYEEVRACARLPGWALSICVLSACLLVGQPLAQDALLRVLASRHSEGRLLWKQLAAGPLCA